MQRLTWWWRHRKSRLEERQCFPAKHWSRRSLRRYIFSWADNQRRRERQTMSDDSSESTCDKSICEGVEQLATIYKWYSMWTTPHVYFLKRGLAHDEELPMNDNIIILKIIEYWLREKWIQRWRLAILMSRDCCTHAGECQVDSMFAYL